MASVFDSQSINIPCPNCPTRHSKTVGWIKTNSKLVCRCGTTISIDKRQFIGEIAKAEKMLDSFPKKITIKL